MKSLKENETHSLCFTGIERSSTKAVQRHIRTLRSIEHRETIMESQEATEIAQFQNKEYQTYR